MTLPGIPTATRRRLRLIRQIALKGRGGRLLSTAMARSSRKPLRRFLIVSDNRAYTSEQQFAPLIRHSAAIAARTGIVFTFMDLAEAKALPAKGFSGWAAVGLKLIFTTPAAEATDIARRILGAAKAAGARTILFDGDDDMSILWPDVLNAADFCIKKHVYGDLDTYTRIFVGKSNLTDYCHRTFNVSFADNIVPQSGELSPKQIGKIVLGWNIAQDDKIHNLANDIPIQATEGPRDIDILCRASVAPGTWTYGMRHGAVEALSRIAGRYRIHAPTDRVSQAEYYGEMLRARLSVSPFGFGELCWRDFESILCGSLLIKPDMSHLTTWPNLFVPFETYIPVAWDYSNLEQVCAPYIADENARCKITATARLRLTEALKARVFTERFEALLHTIKMT